MHSLPLFLKISGRPVILIGTGEAAEAKRRLIVRAGGIVVGEQDADARIAFVALEDETAASATAGRLKARGLLVNVVDQPSLCDFTTPAIVDRNPVLIAVATGGASAGLAKAIRQRLERLLPPSLGVLAASLGGARTAMRARWPEARARRAALDAAMREGGPFDPLAEHRDGAVETWLTAGGGTLSDRTERIMLVSTDPDELTLRAARLLGEADRIIHAGDVPDALLARARADAVRVILPAGSPPPDAPGLTIVLRMGEGSVAAAKS